MKTAYRHQVSAGGVILSRSNAPTIEVALTAHKDLRGNMVWSLPKGIVEVGETIEEAALREVREETGLEGRITNKLGEAEYSFYSRRENARVHKTVHFFQMECIGGDTSLHDWEVQEVRWFPLKSARAILSYGSEREIVDRVQGP